MRNPLNEERLGKGIDTLQTALQGKFSGGFVTVLAAAIRNYTLAEWEGCVEILSRGLKKPMDLTLGDFIQALQEVRHGKALHENIFRGRPSGKWKPDWQKLSEEICADPTASEGSKAIVRGLAARKETSASPPVKGGEKYRRKQS